MAKQREPARTALKDSIAARAPKAVISRLSLYLRELQNVLRAGEETINSRELGERLGITDAQVRKDLANFGQFGRRGVGYQVAQLVPAIRSILGTHQSWAVGLVGVGNLGRALLGYRGFPQQGFRIAAAFDADPRKVGSQVEGVTIYSLEDLPQVVRKQGIRLGIIAVPADAAQAVADRLASAGVSGILNFAPVTIQLPPAVSRVGVDLAIELEQLAFSVLHRESAR
jgi:redox-sensing transcriptional repressor